MMRSDKRRSEKLQRDLEQGQGKKRNEPEYELSVWEPRETNQAKQFLIGIVRFVPPSPSL